MILSLRNNVVSSALVLLAMFTPVLAGGPQLWEMNSRADLLKGEARGVSVTDTGSLILAPRLASIFNTDQAYIWSSAADSAGNVYLGTGHDGRIYRVGPDGRGVMLFHAPELDVTALAVGRDGALYAGTSPDGKVYRIGGDGHSEAYFNPPDKYIWALAVAPDGSLAVGTGDKGKIYRVHAANAKPEASVFANTGETHVISLLADARGDLIAGTDPGGLVLRISPEGKVFALYDSPLREIHALAAAPDGSIYALGLGEAATGVRISSSSASTAASASPSPSEGGGGQGSVSVTITGVEEPGTTGQTAAASRSRNDLSGARSAVFHLLPDGGSDVIWSSTSITAFAIAPGLQGNSVLIGTGDKGRIYSVTNDGRDTLLLQSTEGQISSFLARNNVIYAASSNGGKLFRFGSEPVTEGTYESPVRDSKITASWGTIWWDGSGPVELQTRTGNTERPNATWSEWSASYRDPKGDQISSPRARYIQWRATLRGGSANSAGIGRLDDVSVAYLPRNVAPEVLSISVLPPGVGLQPAVPVPTDPNIEMSGLDPSLFGVVAQGQPRRLYQRGARSLQWQAEDRNGDTLEYAIYYRPINESTFRLLKDKVRDNFYTVDSGALADGRYIFQIVASDAPDNPAGQALTGERLSEPVDIDNTPPVVRADGTPQVAGDRVRIAFDVQDASSRIKRAELSVDGGPWRILAPDDGIADSPRERYTVQATVGGPGEHTISLRAFDSSGNVGSARVAFRR